jgi:hypothetical protein
MRVVHYPLATSSTLLEADIGGILNNAFWKTFHVNPFRILMQRPLDLRPRLGMTLTHFGEIAARDVCMCVDKARSSMDSMNVQINVTSDLGRFLPYSSR